MYISIHKYLSPETCTSLLQTSSNVSSGAFLSQWHSPTQYYIFINWQLVHMLTDSHFDWHFICYIKTIHTSMKTTPDRGFTCSRGFDVLLVHAESSWVKLQQIVFSGGVRGGKFGIHDSTNFRYWRKATKMNNITGHLIHQPIKKCRYSWKMTSRHGYLFPLSVTHLNRWFTLFTLPFGRGNQMPCDSVSALEKRFIMKKVCNVPSLPWTPLPSP